MNCVWNSRARGSGRRLLRYAYAQRLRIAPCGGFDLARTLPPSVAGRIGIVAAGRRRRRVIGIGVGVIVGARGRRSDRRSPDRDARDARAYPSRMSVPGAMPRAAVVADAADETATAIAARG